MKPGKKRKYLVMGFGLGGNGADGIEDSSGFHSSWYLKPDELQRYIDNGHYPSEEIEGCWLIDKIEVLRANPILAFNAPLCNPTLKDQAVDRFADRHNLDDPVFQIICQEFARSGFGHLFIGADKGGLDYVSPLAYVEWWQRNGARIGQVQGGKVVWFEPEIPEAGNEQAHSQLRLLS